MKNVFERKTWAVLVAKATAPKNRIRYAVATGIVVTLMGASTVLGLRASADGAFYRSTVDDMLLLNGRIVKDVPAALTGNQNAYIGLYSALIQYLDDVSLLKGGSGLTPGVSGSAAEGLKIIETDLQSILQANDDMAEGGAAIIALNSFLSRLSAMNAEGGNRVDAVRAYIAKHGTGATAIAQITALDELNLMLRRVMTRLSRVVEAQAADVSVVGEIKNDLAAMRARLRGLFGAEKDAAVPAITEPAALRLLTTATEKVLPYYIEVEDRVDTLAHIVRTKEKATAIPQAVEKIYRETVVLSDYADARRAQSDTFYGIAIALNLIAALLTTLFFLTVARKNREEAEKVQKENDALQDSIASLLDDVSGIAGGDLTGRAKVTENDVTGVIADAFNMTTNYLSNLVVGIKRSSGEVTESAKSSLERASAVTSVAHRQQEQVAEATEIVMRMTESVDAVSDMAAQASRVASTSHRAATAGKQAVGEVIRDMSEIRSQIQDASKRLKRVGESTQEITGIGEIIGDISRRTHVLALNAAVQAAAAGESGRAFAAVAGEVQRLAARADEQLKKIQKVAVDMQTDTREAISSMESTTQKVVSGTDSSQKAGVALDEIDTVTRSLNDLVSTVNRATETQKSEAVTVRDRMTSVLALAKDTVVAIKQAVTDIQRIADSSKTVRDSVNGFKVQGETK